MKKKESMKMDKNVNDRREKKDTMEKKGKLLEKERGKEKSKNTMWKKKGKDLC